MKRVALYLRVSTLDQHPETQVLDLRQLAAQRGYEIVAEYTDKISGTKARRPGLDQMMADARQGRFDVIMVWASDRIARSVKHFLELLDELNHLNIEYVSFREQLDTAGPLGRAMVVIIGAIAELERNLIVERVRAGMRRARLEGQRIGRPPLNVDRDAVVRDRGRGQSLANSPGYVRHQPRFRAARAALFSPPGEAVHGNSRERRNCKRKLRHRHYLSALLHACRLRQDEDLIIYPCSLCSHLHVGHSGKMKGKRTLTYANDWERKKARLERRIARVQDQLAQLQLNLQRLLATPPQPSQEAEAPRQGTLGSVTKGGAPAPLYVTESTDPKTLVFAVTKGMACGTRNPTASQAAARCRTSSRIEISCVTCAGSNNPSTPRTLKSIKGVSYNRDGSSQPLWVRWSITMFTNSI